MKKKIIISLSVLIGWIIFPMPSRAAELKIVVVAMERVFDEYHKTKAANEILKTRSDEADIEHSKLMSNVKTLKKELEILNTEADDDSLSETERKKKRSLIKEKFKKYRNAENQLIEFNRTYTKELSREMRKIQEKLVKEIRDTIHRYIKGKGVILVLDSSGKSMNRVESIVYFDQALDITDDIIALLNKNSPDLIKKK